MFRRAVKASRSFLESVHHPLYRFVEQPADQFLQGPRTKLKIDIEVDNAIASIVPVKGPVVGEVSKRSFVVDHVDTLRTIEAHARGETFTKHFEPDHQIGDERVRTFSTPDPACHTPGQEIRILLDIGDQIEHLLGSVGNGAFLRVSRHAAENVSELNLSQRCLTGRVKILEITIGVIGRAGQRRRRHHLETFRFADTFVFFELLRGHEAVNGSMA